MYIRILLLLLMNVFAVNINAQNSMDVFYGGIHFKVPTKSIVKKYAYTDIFYMNLSWPTGMWETPASSEYFRLSAVDPSLSVERAVMSQMQAFNLKNRRDSTIVEPGLDSHVQVLIVESKGQYSNSGDYLITCYAIKNLLNDSTFSGSYYTKKNSKGKETITTIRNILMKASAQKSLLKNNQKIVEQYKATVDVDKDIVFKKLEGTQIMLALPQFATVSSNFNKVMIANFRALNIIYSVPAIHHSTAKEYVFDYLSILFKNSNYPPNQVPENGAEYDNRSATSYVYMGRALSADKKDETYCVIGSKSLSGIDYILYMRLEMSEDKMKNQEMSDWIMKMIKYTMLRAN